MKKRIKKTALFMIIFGLVILLASLWFGYGEYEVLIQNGINNISEDSLGIIIGLISGLIFLIIGLIWFFRYRTNHSGNARLKRHGKKTHARFLHQQETDHEIDGHIGIILYLQGEGSNRIFQTQPIFSEFSIKWLEEHVFDVYISTTNSDEYYIDMEKHFGEPLVHNEK